MTLKRFVAPAGLAAVLLTASPVLAQTGPAPDPAPATSSPAAMEQAVRVVTAMTAKFNGMLSDLGLEAPGVSLGVSPEMAAAAFPKSAPGDVGDVGFGFNFKVRDEATATAPLENPDELVLLTDAQGCTPAQGGEIASFRTMALENAAGHQCAVVMQDGLGFWGFSARSVAIAGDVSVVFIYYLTVQMDGRPERARELGETAREGAIRLSAALADQTLAAVAVGEHRGAQDPAEQARRLGRLMERTAEAAVAGAQPPATE